MASSHDYAHAHECDGRAHQIKAVKAPALEYHSPQDRKHDENAAIGRVDVPECGFTLECGNHTVEKQNRTAQDAE